MKKTNRYWKSLFLAVVFCGALSQTVKAQEIGFMHPLGTQPSKILKNAQQNVDSRYGALHFNPYHILQPELSSPKEGVPVYAVYSGEIYDIEKTENEGLKVFIMHENGGRSSYSFLDKEQPLGFVGKISRGSIIGYTSPAFNNKLKYELVAENGYVIRHNMMVGKKNSQNFMYGADDVAFAFYNPNPLGGATSTPSSVYLPDESQQEQMVSSYYVAQQFNTTTSSANMSDDQIEGILCPWQIRNALTSSAQMKLLNMEKIRDITMKEPADVKMLSCFDGFVRKMTTDIATKGIFGRIINIFGPNGTSNLNYGSKCNGSNFVWDLVTRSHSLTVRQTSDDDPNNIDHNAHRNIMYAGLSGSWRPPGTSFASVFGPNLSSRLSAFFQPGVRGYREFDGRIYPMNASMSHQARNYIDTIISGERVRVMKSGFVP